MSRQNIANDPASAKKYQAIYEEKVGESTGDMAKAVYDPTNVSGDAFDSANTNYDNSISGITATKVKTALDETVNQAIWVSAGSTTDASYTDNGDGTVDIGTVDVLFYPNGSFEEVKVKATLPAKTITLTDGVNILNYIYADYNSGTPQISVTTNFATLNPYTALPLITATRSGTAVGKISWNTYGLGYSEKAFQKDVALRRFEILEGLSLSETGTRNIAITTGKVYYGTKLVTVPAFNSSTTGTLQFVYHVGGVWTNTVNAQYNNTQYDDGTDLVELTANRYAVNWIYKNADDDTDIACIVLGNGDYTLADAEASSPPSTPVSVSGLCKLVGRIIVKKGDTTATAVENFEALNFNSVPITNHNDLNNIQLASDTVTYGHIDDQSQTIYGEKTFNTFPVTPSSAPDADYEVANKKYVDDNTGGGASIYEATVGATGADYTTLGAAITAGKTRVLVIDDTTETGDITLPSNCVIHGIGREAVNVDMVTYAFLDDSGANANFTFEDMTITSTKTSGRMINALNGSLVFKDLIFDFSGATTTYNFTVEGATDFLYMENIQFNLYNANAVQISINKTGGESHINSIMIKGGGSSCQNAFNIKGVASNLSFTGTWGTDIGTLDSISMSNIWMETSSTLTIGGIYDAGLVTNLNAVTGTIKISTGLTLSNFRCNEIISEFSNARISNGFVEGTSTDALQILSGDNQISVSNVDVTGGIDITGNDVSIIGCKVGADAGGGSRTITINSGANRTIITGTRTDVAISDSGTDTVTAGNVVY